MLAVDEAHGDGNRKASSFGDLHRQAASPPDSSGANDLALTPSEPQTPDKPLPSPRPSVSPLGQDAVAGGNPAQKAKKGKKDAYCNWTYEEELAFFTGVREARNELYHPLRGAINHIAAKFGGTKSRDQVRAYLRRATRKLEAILDPTADTHLPEERVLECLDVYWLMLLALGLDRTPTHTWWKKEASLKQQAINLVQQALSAVLETAAAAAVSGGLERKASPTSRTASKRKHSQGENQVPVDQACPAKSPAKEGAMEAPDQPVDVCMAEKPGPQAAVDGIPCTLDAAQTAAGLPVLLGAGELPRKAALLFTPLDDDAYSRMTAAGLCPNLELMCRTKTRVVDVIAHVGDLWQAVDGGKISLHPHPQYKALRLAGVRWSMSDTDAVLSVGDLFNALGRPEPFQLYYTWQPGPVAALQPGSSLPSPQPLVTQSPPIPIAGQVVMQQACGRRETAPRTAAVEEAHGDHVMATAQQPCGGHVDPMPQASHPVPEPMHHLPQNVTHAGDHTHRVPGTIGSFSDSFTQGGECRGDNASGLNGRQAAPHPAPRRVDGGATGAGLQRGAAPVPFSASPPLENGASTVAPRFAPEVHLHSQEPVVSQSVAIQMSCNPGPSLAQQPTGQAPPGGRAATLPTFHRGPVQPALGVASVENAPPHLPSFRPPAGSTGWGQNPSSQLPQAWPQLLPTSAPAVLPGLQDSAIPGGNDGCVIDKESAGAPVGGAGTLSGLASGSSGQAVGFETLFSPPGLGVVPVLGFDMSGGGSQPGFLLDLPELPDLDDMPFELDSIWSPYNVAPAAPLGSPALEVVHVGPCVTQPGVTHSHVGPCASQPAPRLLSIREGSGGFGSPFNPEPIHAQDVTPMDGITVTLPGMSNAGRRESAQQSFQNPDSPQGKIPDQAASPDRQGMGKGLAEAPPARAFVGANVSNTPPRPGRGAEDGRPAPRKLGKENADGNGASPGVDAAGRLQKKKKGSRRLRHFSGEGDPMAQPRRTSRLGAGTRAGDAAGPEGLRRGTCKAGGDADPTRSLPDNCDDGAEEGLQTLDALFPMLAGLADDAAALDDAMDHSSPDFQFPTEPGVREKSPLAGCVPKTPFASERQSSLSRQFAAMDCLGDNGSPLGALDFKNMFSHDPDSFRAPSAATGGGATDGGLLPSGKGHPIFRMREESQAASLGLDFSINSLQFGGNSWLGGLNSLPFGASSLEAAAQDTAGNSLGDRPFAVLFPH